MHPFTLSRINDPSAAIVAHAADPHAAFIASGTDLIGLMKDRAAHPDRLLDINSPLPLATPIKFSSDDTFVP